MGEAQSADILSRIRVVLHRPSHPGNIGAAARALKTMGLSRLVLVSPRRFPDPEADALAAGALDVLEHVTVCHSIGQALQGTVLAVAFSARPRELSHPVCDARAAAGEAVGIARSADVALVFGNETAGLANEDVLKCNRLACIPADTRYSSLNLAAAVQVVAYEIRMAALVPLAPASTVSELAPAEELERLYEHFELSLRDTGFLDPGKPKRLMERLRRLFGRAALEREEVNILRGMLTAWDEHAARCRQGAGKS
jgi:tRNA/rRNA methyltransferase